MSSSTLAPGNRITLRSEDFLVTKTHGQLVKPGSKTGELQSYVVECEGLSELVRGQRFVFDLAIDNAYEVVEAEKTRLFADTSPNFNLTRLYLESRLRSADVAGKRIALAHKGALNVADYQMEPALMALQQPFARILIADAVGLGKTAEVGILLTELMRRGRAKRVLVLALKSVLAQFQQEIWNRFAFPLVRLDSEGVSTLRAKLPANKNPFNYYDRVIVSIDTLKKNSRFQHYLENTRWDVVVIDECHNVANLGSQRGNLASLLARRCDNLIFTSATPHSGDAGKFANLMRMLEPTIAPMTASTRTTVKKGWGQQDKTQPYFDREIIHQHVIRRFKKDLPKQVQTHFRDRELHAERAQLRPLEVDFLAWQQNLKQAETATLEGSKRNMDALFSVGIFKAYLSSPWAAKVSLEKRMRLVEREGSRVALSLGSAAEDFQEQFENLNADLGHRMQSGSPAAELSKLATGLALVEQVLAKAEDAKLVKLFELLDSLKWKGHSGSERIVLFAERVDTLAYLERAIAERYGLLPAGGDDEVLGHSNTAGIARFDGSLPDTQQQRVIEDFGLKSSETRLLLSSDAGSQGVNLHYMCHRMINYDLPWSLITLEQRNGRIDRYGQDETPHIHYILAESDVQGLKTDLRVVDVIREKEELAYQTLGDAGAIMQLHDVEAEERATAAAVGRGDVGFADTPQNKPEADFFDLSSILNGTPDTSAGAADAPPSRDLDLRPQEVLSLYPSDKAFYQALLAELERSGALQHGAVSWESEDLVRVDLDKDLRQVLYDVPREALPPSGKMMQLSLKPATVKQAIVDARKRNKEWAQFQLLYDAHPLAQYWLTAMQSHREVPKDGAPVARLQVLPKGEAHYLFYGQATNAIGTSLLSDFYVMSVDGQGERLKEPLSSLDEFWRKLNQPAEAIWIDRNTDADTLGVLQGLLPEVVQCGRTFRLEPALHDLTGKMQRQEQAYLQRLGDWDEQERNSSTARRGSAAVQNELAFSSGKSRYERFTEMRKGSHVQLLAVLHNL